jgi:hypothetical protein
MEGFMADWPVASPVPEVNWDAIVRAVSANLAFLGTGGVSNLGDGLFLTTFASVYERRTYQVMCQIDPTRSHLGFTLFTKQIRFSIVRRKGALKGFFEYLNEASNCRLPSDSHVSSIEYHYNGLRYAACRAILAVVSSTTQEDLFKDMDALRGRFDDLVVILKMAAKQGADLAHAKVLVDLSFDASIGGEEH